MIGGVRTRAGARRELEISHQAENGEKEEDTNVQVKREPKSTSKRRKTAKTKAVKREDE